MGFQVRVIKHKKPKVGLQQKSQGRRKDQEQQMKKDVKKREAKVVLHLGHLLQENPIKFLTLIACFI